MAAKNLLLLDFIVLLMISGFISQILASKLNVPKLLLPYYSSVATNFTLEVSQGCFIWTSSRPEIASVSAIRVNDDTECSQTAVVTATSRVVSRKTAIVLAQDSVTGQQLRCDVIVDDIEKIEIVTTTRELYLDDTPEQFEIRAINEDGDVFSSLDGVEFEWNLLPDNMQESSTVVPAQSVLRFLKFSESNYEAPKFIQNLEELGKRGDRILMRGIRTGSARVSAKIVDKVYKNVKEDVVRIVVIANIQLNPSLVYLLQHTTVTYTVELLKQGKIHVISMPSDQYELQVENEDIAVVDANTSTATALIYGDTEVKLKDQNIKMSGAFREPAAAIYVVTPGYLDFDIYPGNNWVIETNKVYEIIIKIYDKESHKIFPSDGIRVEAVFPNDHFEVLSSSENGTYHIVRTKLRGFTSIEGKLKAVVHKDGTIYEVNPIIEGSQEVEIYDPVTVTPKMVVLPWDPLGKVIYQYQLNVTGGCGNYTWKSVNSTVGMVTGRGLLTAGNTVGYTRVTVSDARNPAHYDTMKFLVLPPGEMEFLPSVVEAEVVSQLDLPLAVYGSYGDKRYTFDRCDKMPLKTSVKDNTVFDYIDVSEPTKEGSCADIKVEGKYMGSTEVDAEYSYRDSKISATVTVAAYKPLKPIDPELITVVTRGSSKEIVFEGGPQPWVVDTSGYYQNVAADKPDLLVLKPIKSYENRKSFHIFHVSCLELGDQKIKLAVGNKPTTKNKFPASAEASVRFVCDEPKGLRLIPLVPQPENLPPCPMNLEFDDPVAAHYNQPLDFLVTVHDAEGRSFDNFSSLAIEWQLSDQSLASFPDGTHSVNNKVSNAEAGRKKTISFKTINTASMTGHLQVTASITKYNKDYFAKHSLEITLGSPIKTQRELNLVQDAVITPEYLTLYNHGTNTAALQLSEGSGYFHMDYSNVGQAVVEYDRKSRDIRITPATEGAFTVLLYDLCLKPEAPAKATVFVSDVYQILLYVVDKVELGKQITARVQVMDRNNQAIPTKYFSVMKLQARIGTNLITVRSSPEKAADDITGLFIVQGIALGRTNLQFVATQQSSKIVSSQPRGIQVFPCLRLSPRNITLIIGAVFQVSATGGPLPESTIEYSISSDEIATVSNEGLVDAKTLGITKVTGKAVGVDESGKIVYSQDEVIVNVIELTGIKVHAPLKRMQSDTQMPVYAMGLDENESPFSFGSAYPPLSFDWSISNSDVAQLQPIFHKSGIQPSLDNNFAMRFLAASPGHVTVHLKVKPQPGSYIQIKNGALLSDSVQIQVFEKLQLHHPDICDGVFVMATNTDAHIKTNRDGSSAKLSYTVIDKNALLTNHEPVIVVGDGGQVTSFSRTGEASLLITSQEDFGVNQTLVVLVKVKSVSYIKLNSDTVISTRSPQLTAVPVGTMLHFTISFHDDVGMIFFATSNKISFRSNRFDLLQISHGTSNNTLTAKATNIGQTVVKVWDRKYPHLADYISIDVGSAISPSDITVTLGDIICFSSPVVGESGNLGSWLSDSTAVHIERNIGTGVASHVGQAVISYSPSPLTTTHTTVKVTSISRVTLKNEYVHYLTNVVTKSRVGVIQVLLEGQHNGPNIHGPNCSEHLRDLEFPYWRPPFRCEVAMTKGHPHLLVEDIVKIDEVFDSKTAQYHCRLSQQSSSHESAQTISMLDTSIQLRAVVPERDGQPEVVSSMLSLPFLPAFYIHNTEIQLSNLLPRVHLRISAIERVMKEIKLTPSDDTLIKILDAEGETQTDYVVSYPIMLQLASSLWARSHMEASIIVRCVSTGQSQTVAIRIKLLGEQGTQMDSEIGWNYVINKLAANYQNVLLFFFCTVATILCLAIAYQAVIGQKYMTAANQSMAFLPPDAQQTHQTPMQQSPWTSPQNISQSPSRLWSVDTGPYGESGIFKRSPMNRSSPRN